MRGEFIGVNGERMYMAVHFDRRGRPFRDLRISVTDRCNMRCDYCMPADVFDANHDFLPRSDLLTFEEIDEVVTSLISHGLKKVRITGGEPLLRRDLDVLIRMLSKHPLDLALTTNGLLFSKCAKCCFPMTLNYRRLFWGVGSQLPTWKSSRIQLHSLCFRD